MKHKSVSALTIPELVIAMTVLAILSTIGFLSYIGYTSKARDTARASDIKNIAKVLDLYHLNSLKYPSVTDGTSVTHSGALVWTQGVFGKDTQNELGKIFGNLVDPKYKNPYTYSTTANQKEYQVAVVFEKEPGQRSFTKLSAPEFISSTYAAGDFSPQEFSPKIWLDATDIDGDGNPGNNPSNGSTLTAWVNKSTDGAINNPTVTHGSLRYAENGYNNSYPGVFIENNAGLRLENSDISQGDIFYVVQKNDPFHSNIDSNGYGLFSTSDRFYAVGYWNKYRNALRIGNAPNHASRSPATRWGRTDPYIYGFYTNGTNYGFRDTGYSISQGATNSITGHTWAFNKAGAVQNKNSDLVVSEILIFDSVLQEDQRKIVEGYLAHKWGLAYWLPWSHPYRDEAPESQGPPPAPDTEPDIFTLNDITGANVSTLYTSNSVTIGGITAQSPVSISGGNYSINGGEYTASGGFISQGDVIDVQITSSNNSNSTVTSTLTIGGVSEDFSVTTLAVDVTPDDFQFTPVVNGDISTSYVSNSVSISGMNSPAVIQISGTGAEYKISNGEEVLVTSGGNASSNHNNSDAGKAFDKNTGSSGWQNTGTLPSYLRYDLGVGNEKIVTKYTLYRSSLQDGDWWDSDSPKNWTFEASDNGITWTTLDTQTNQYIYVDSPKKVYNFTNNQSYRFYRLNISASRDNYYDWLNITEVEFISEDGGGTFTTGTGSVVNGDIISVRMPSSPNPGTTKTAQLQLGTLTRNYSITTLGPDNSPDLFSFHNVEDANLNQLYTSNSITVSGINTNTSLSISGDGEYSINSQAYTTVAGSVQNGDVIQIRQYAASNNSQTKSSTLTIGDISATYNVTTPAPAPDTTPDAFSFQAIADAMVSTSYTSNSVMISGINTSTPLSISGGKYDINGSKNYVSSSSTVEEGDIISLQGISGSTPGSTDTVSLNVGGVISNFIISTISADTIPDNFSFSDISGADVNILYESDDVTIQGINTSTPISLVGSGEMSINGGSWQSISTSINNGDSIRLRNTASPIWNTSVVTTVNVGGVEKSFSIITGDGDIIPDTFTFNDILDASLDAQYISDAITITGINASTPISVVGGEYKIGDGEFTDIPGVVKNNDIISVRLISALQGLTTKSVTLNIGGITDSFDVTTLDYTGEKLLSVLPQSRVQVLGNYNGLIAHAFTGNTHSILASPSIISSDLSSTEFSDIVQKQAFVYNGYNNTPVGYLGELLSEDNKGFNFKIVDPLLYSGSKRDLGSYGGLKQIDEGVRSIYGDFPSYKYMAQYLDDYSLKYLEDIIGQNIGINPIRPYYCSDILRSKLVKNIAPLATISSSSSSDVSGIANGIISTEGNLDREFLSSEKNELITFDWEKSYKVGHIRIYNRTGCCSDRLTGANIKLYNKYGGLVYSHSLWDTNNDFVVDLDLEGIGKLFSVNRLTIQSVGGNYLNLREIEIFLGGDISDGIFKVDKDGLGGQNSYNVFCDMTTDGGGWTRIGENYVTNGRFRNQSHVDQHTFRTYDNLNDNLIIDTSTMPPPEGVTDAYVLKHNGSNNESYELYFPDVPGEYFAQEIRLSAWVKNTSGSIFQNTIEYKDTPSMSSRPDYEVMETQGDWEYRRVRLPLSGRVDSFTWELGKGISGPFFVTDLKMELYYK